MDAAGHHIEKDASPVNAQDAATKSYVDWRPAPQGALKTDGSNFMSANLNMNENRVEIMTDPVNEQDSVNKRFLEARLTDYLKRNGSEPMTFNLDMADYPITNTGDPQDEKDAASKKSVDNAPFVRTDSSTPLAGDLKMGTHKIKNLGTPGTNENDAAVNVGFLNSEVNASNLNLSTQLTAAYKKYVNESLVTPSGHAGNAFSYLMEDADESSSENNISVSGIVDFDGSVHQMNKNAYRLALVKDSQDHALVSILVLSRLGIIPSCANFSPVVMSNVSVTALGTTISINSQTTKTFPTYTKTLVQFHRWNSTPPQFIYLDLHDSAAGGGSRVLAHMVVYGVKGYVPKVPSSVFDQVYAVENGRMVSQTDFDLHGHRLLNRGFEGFEIDSEGRLKLHTDIDLNKHHIKGVLSLHLNGIKLNNDLDLDGLNLVSQGVNLLGYNKDLYGDKIFIARPLTFQKPVTLPGMSVWIEGLLLNTGQYNRLSNNLV